MARETALDQAIGKLRRQNEQIAFVGCGLVDRFLKARTAENLEAIKNFVRLGLQDSREHLNRLRARNPRRRRHFGARIHRRPELGRRLNLHIAALKERVQLYEHRRIVLQEVADAAIWALLDGDIKQTAFLHKAGGHDLPTNVGLAGVVQLQHNLHASGKFLAMENDLTRCARVGDLTVVRTDGRSRTPMLLEVKTHSEEEALSEGMTVGIIVITATADNDTLTELMNIVGEDLPEELKVSARGERQAAEITERTQLIAKALSSGAKSISAPTRNWEAFRRVIRRAEQAGFSFDVAEPGVFPFAVRVQPGDDIRSAVATVRTRVSDLANGEIRVGLSHQIHEREDLSGMVLPVALWELPLTVRASILANSMLVGTFIELDLFVRLFAAKGIALTETDGGWVLARSGSQVHFDDLHVASIELGLVVTAMSPASLVEAVDRALAELEQEEQRSHIA